MKTTTKLRKRILAVLMCLMMTFQNFPLAIAEEAPAVPDVVEEQIALNSSMEESIDEEPAAEEPADEAFPC